MHIKMTNAGTRYQNIHMQKQQTGQLKTLQRWFMCVEYDDRKQLVFATSNRLRSEREWSERQQSILRPNNSTGKYFENLY